VATRSRSIAKKTVRRHYPVLIEIRSYSRTILEQPELPLAELIRGVMDSPERSAPEGWWERELKRGRVLLLIDGLDEVADPISRVKVSDWFEIQLDRYPLCGVIVTSRPHGYEERPMSALTVLKTVPFTPEQVETFVDSWYFAITERRHARLNPEIRKESKREAVDLIGRIKASAAIRDMASNPLLLTMICHVHYYRGALPGSRSELYDEICQVFLGKRQLAKSLPLQSSIAQRTLVLENLSIYMMKRGVRAASRLEAQKHLAPTIARFSKAAPNVFLDSIIDETGLLIEPRAGEVSFVHLTIQEYLAANWIASSRESAIILENLDLSWWRETIILYASLGDATNILDTCLKDETIDRFVLASDCLEVARDLDRSTRDTFEARLHSYLAEFSDPTKRFIAVGMTIFRGLRDTAHLQNSVYVCSNSVTADIYEQFVIDSRIEGRDRRLDFCSLDSHIAIYRSSDVASLIAWINAHSSGAVFRLPSLAEVNRMKTLADKQDLPDLSEATSLWIERDGTPTVLELKEPRAPISHAIRMWHDIEARVITTTVDPTEIASAYFESKRSIERARSRIEVPNNPWSNLSFEGMLRIQFVGNRWAALNRGTFSLDLDIELVKRQISRSRDALSDFRNDFIKSLGVMLELSVQAFESATSIRCVEGERSADFSYSLKALASVLDGIRYVEPGPRLSDGFNVSRALWDAFRGMAAYDYRRSCSELPSKDIVVLVKDLGSVPTTTGYPGGA
jgi:hypothetical protein